MTSGQVLRRLFPISLAVIGVGFIWMFIGAFFFGEKQMFMGMFIALGGVVMMQATYAFGFDTPLDGFNQSEWERRNKNTRY